MRDGISGLWTLWTRTGKPAPPAPSRPPEPRVTVNRVHGYVSFNQAALSLMGLTESRVELLYDQDTGLLGFRREEAGQRLCHDQGPPSRGPEASQAGRRKVREVRACPRRCRLGKFHVCHRRRDSRSRATPKCSAGTYSAPTQGGTYSGRPQHSQD